MLVLITNDDGIAADGLFALKQAVAQVADVVVVAPDHNWSAAGHAKTMHKPLRVTSATLRDGSPAFSSSGAPSDCVALAVLGLTERMPDLVISGINHGCNLGTDITYSGTVTAAMEGVISGIRSMAVSLNVGDGSGFPFAAEIAACLATRFVESDLPQHTLLNVNVPDIPRGEIKGIRATRLGRRIYRDALIARKDPGGRDYYWIGGNPPEGVMEEGTDVWAIANGYVSVTPVHLDMTDYKTLEASASWEHLLAACR